MQDSAKEIVITSERHVSCEGLEAPYDHPLVYLEIDVNDGKVECPYCSKIFVLKK